MDVCIAIKVSAGDWAATKASSVAQMRSEALLYHEIAMRCRPGMRHSLIHSLVSTCIRTPGAVHCQAGSYELPFKCNLEDMDFQIQDQEHRQQQLLINLLYRYLRPIGPGCRSHSASACLASCSQQSPRRVISGYVDGGAAPCDTLSDSSNIDISDRRCQPS